MTKTILFVMFFQTKSTQTPVNIVLYLELKEVSQKSPELSTTPQNKIQPPEDPPCSCVEYSRMPELVWRLTIPMTMLAYSLNSNW